MFEILLMIYISLNLINCYDYYYISVFSIAASNSENSLHIYNNFDVERPITDFIYTGKFEDIEKIVYDSRDNLEDIKNQNHPWVYIPYECSNKYINYFSNKTIFLANYACYINSSAYENYSDYTFTFVGKFVDYLKTVQKSNFFYGKIGKGFDLDSYKILGIVFATNLIIGIICAIITRRKIKKITFLNFLPIYIINYNFYYVLLGVNMFNVFILFATNPTLNVVAEYLFLLGQSFYLSHFYSIIIIILRGYMITDFSLGIKIKKYFFYLLIYGLLFSVILNLSLYFFQITSKLNLYYFKNEMEQIVFMSFLVYCIYKVLIPLYKQKNIEQRRGSNLVECITFKYKKLLRLYIFMGICSVLIFISPFIEHAVLYEYLYDFYFHYIFVIIYELIFCVGVNFIFLSETLPLYYFDDIIFNYKEIDTLVADITEDKDKNKFNISKLTLDKLKKNIKNETPILFLNPFSSTKNSVLFNQFQLGITSKDK